MIYLSLQERKVFLFLVFLILFGVCVGFWYKATGNRACCTEIFSRKLKAERVNINTATLQEFESLYGIGPKTAELIIEYRNINGNFKSIDELKNVKGVTTAKFEKIKSNLYI